MRILFPYSPLDKKLADGPFEDEYRLFSEMGINSSLFDYDALAFDEFKPTPKINAGDTILYRGWMLNPGLYANLVKMVEAKGAKMLTSVSDFLLSHHLPNWYEQCKDLTPKSYFFTASADIVAEAGKLGWDKFFVKDYVKSNYNERGSIAYTATEVQEIINLIREHRGEIEGGISLREVEDLKAETETRYFIFNGKPYSPDGTVPDIVHLISQRHQALFYSVDIVQRSDGILRLIEIGDGQVSDRKNWNASLFCKALAENI